MKMISRRIFFSICMMMATILVMFQFSILVRDIVNNYNDNVYLNEKKLSRTDAWSEQTADGDVQTVVYIGNNGSAEFKMIRQWCGYTKRRFLRFSSLLDYEAPEDGDPVLLCLSGSAVPGYEELVFLSNMLREGQCVLFCELPSTASITQMSMLREILGIKELVQPRVELVGIHLFSGFFLGGETIYTKEDEEKKLDEEISMSAPWYLRLSGTKSYMVGMLEDEEVENEKLPSLLWRNSYGKGRVFVVNGPYMQDETGLGILSAIIYETNEYDLYPVVNAQNLSVVDFPLFSSENKDELMGIYQRDLIGVQSGIVWPGLISASSKSKYKMTSFLAPRLDYSSNDSLNPDELPFYLKQFREQDAEAGLSLDHFPGISLKDKLEVDKEFFNASATNYSYGAAYVADNERSAFLSIRPRGMLESVHTVTGDWKGSDLLYYCAPKITAQGITADGFLHTYSQDLRVKSIETALCYSNILLNMKYVSRPEGEKHHWQVLSEVFASNINTYWNAFRALDKTTLSESDERVRAFFAADYSHSRKDNVITLNLKKENGECWFLLRTHGEEIMHITGGEYTDVERDVYLIRMLDDTAQIKLEAPDNKRYYLS